MSLEQTSHRAAALLTAFLLGVSASLNAGDWKHITEADGLPVSMVQFMERIGDDVWVGTLDGLVRFTDGKGTKIVAGQAVWDILPDGRDTYWLGTAKGILRLEDGKLSESLTGTSVGTLERFGEQGVWAVAEDRDRFSLRELRDGKWQAHPRLKGQSVSELFPTSNGTVWALVETNGIVAADPAQEPDEWVHHLRGFNVQSFCRDDKGRIWCGTWDRGIKLLENGEWKTVLKQEPAAITAIVQDGDGHIWAATNANGVWQYDGEKWHNHLREVGIINVLERTADGRVHASGQSVAALRVWDGKAWTDLVAQPGGFRTVLLGPGNKLWAGHTLSGVYVQP
jgi:ligand-binding sensor domain-containing protein